MLTLTERPTKFKDVVGQDQNIKAFKNMAKTKEGTFPQVLMLSGATGTGKSTLGAIIGSFINCHNPVKEDDYYEPCGECSSCQDIQGEKYALDFVYKDASNMSKDDVIALKKEANSSGVYGGKKIIMIEEAQQLASQGAKGALLKVLEEKNPDVHFILLTMDIKKFDQAIVDRCQVYNFKPIKRDIIEEYLFSLLQKLDPDDKIPESIFKVIMSISENCNGSLRKAIGDFERCLIAEVYTEDDLQDFLGYITEDQAFSILLNLLKKDKEAIIAIEKVDLMKFYNYTFAILLNVRGASITGNFKSDYIKQRAEAILATRKLHDLLDVYMKIKDSFSTHNNEYVIRYHLYKFMEIPEGITLGQKLDPPKRRRRSIKED